MTLVLPCPAHAGVRVAGVSLCLVSSGYVTVPGFAAAPCGLVLWDPRYVALTSRPATIRVRFQDLTGAWYAGEIRGFGALLFQHEYVAFGLGVWDG